MYSIESAIGVSGYNLILHKKAEEMVAEPWKILKMGNQVSHNLKHAFLLEPSSKKKPTHRKPQHKETIGILSFEVANVMSRAVRLHESLTDQEMHKIKNEILNSEGVKNLVSSDESYLLELALSEKLDDLNRIASVISRLGKKCSEPALQGFEHVYGDVMNRVIEVRELGFLVKDMDGMTRKMERYVNATSNLYNEMEVLNELEQATKKFQQNQHEESRRAFEQKLIWQKQDVRHLKDVSLWNQTYDKVVELLARTVCTIYARICVVFGESSLRRVSLVLSERGSTPINGDSLQIPGRRRVSLGLSERSCTTPVSGDCGEISCRRSAQPASQPLKPELTRGNAYQSKPSDRTRSEKRRPVWKPEVALVRPEDFMFPCGSPGRLFMECLSLSSSASKLDDVDIADRSSQTSGCCSVTNSLKRQYSNGSQIGVPLGGDGDQRQSKCCPPNSSQFGVKTRLTVHAPPSTIGGSALALHYANIIIVIEKLLRYPHLVGEEARDDLYQMLPTSLRVVLKTSLKDYVKNLAIYDAPLAHDWKEILDDILRWLAPLAHNMIRWQNERNFENQHIVSRTNVLLLQTLFFADREKTEASICELLVGLTYICRYEHQQNALLDCASSFDLDDCMEWQSQSSHLQS